MTRKRRPPAERFEAFIEHLEDGCWRWSGALDGTGYGKFWNGERLAPAHRFSYELHVGPIPEGLQLDHLCRVRRCVNPAHLEPVTTAENVRRGAKAKLIHGDIAEIRASSASTTALAERFGVSWAAIWGVRTGRRWVGVDEEAA